MTDKNVDHSSGVSQGKVDDIHAESLSPKEQFTMQIQANQTYLAWVRTSIALLGFGLVLAKLALWVLWMAPDLHNKHFLKGQQILGTTLLAGGTLLVIVMTIVHRETTRTIRKGRIPELGLMPAYVLTGMIALIGSVLTGLVMFW
jgi:putative membrane protein